MISYIYYWVHIDECSRMNPLQEMKKMTNIKIEYVEDSDEPVCYSENGRYAICLDADRVLYTRWFGDGESSFGIRNGTTIAWELPHTLQGWAINKLLADIAQKVTDIFDLWSVEFSEYRNTEIGIFSDDTAAEKIIDQIGYLIQEYETDESLHCDILDWQDIFVNNESPDKIFHYMFNQEGLKEYPDIPILVLGNAETAAKQRLWDFIESIDDSSPESAKRTIEAIQACYDSDGFSARFWGSFIPELVYYSDHITVSKQGIYYDGSLIIPKPSGIDLMVRVSDALAHHAIPDSTGGFTARIGSWDIGVPADGSLVSISNTAAGVYTTLPWEYAATIDFSGDTLVYLDSAGAITAEIKIEVES